MKEHTIRIIKETALLLSRRDKSLYKTQDDYLQAAISCFEKTHEFDSGKQALVNCIIECRFLLERCIDYIHTQEGIKEKGGGDDIQPESYDIF